MKSHRSIGPIKTPQDSRQHPDDRACVGARSLRAVAARVASRRHRQLDRGFPEGRRSACEELTRSARRRAVQARPRPPRRSHFVGSSKFLPGGFSCLEVRHSVELVRHNPEHQSVHRREPARM